jgi:outer membrane protein assembly factor BamB
VRSKTLLCLSFAATCAVSTFPPAVALPPQPADPLVTVSPAEVEIGDTIRVSATGFAPGAVVDVFLDRTDVATAAVTDGGEVKARIVGDDVRQQGQRSITLLERGSGRSAHAKVVVGPLLAPVWTTPVRDVGEGESIFWTDVHGEYAYPVGVVGSTAIVAWNGSVIGTEGPETRRSTIAGLDMASGEERWSHEGELAMGSIASSGSRIVDASREGRLVVGLAGDTGAIGWRRWFSPGGFIDPTAVGDVVVGLVDRRSSVEALDPGTGATAWRVDPGVRPSSTASRQLVGDGETLWVAVGEEWGPWGLRQLDPTTGEIVASIMPPPRARSLLAATVDEIYVAGWAEGRWSSDLGLAALEPDGGGVRWVRAVMPKDCRSETESCIPRGIQVVPAGDLVVVRTFVERIPEEPCGMGCPYGRDLWALDAGTGHPVWHVTLEDDWEGGPGLEVADGVLYATDDTLVARSLENGAVLATVSAPERPEGQDYGPQRYSSGVVATGGTLLVGTWSGTIMASEAITVSPYPDSATLLVFDLPTEPTSSAEPVPTSAHGATTWARAWILALIGVASGLLVAIGLILLMRRRHPPRHVAPSPR